MIIDSGVFGVAAAVPVATWDEIIVGRRREFLGNAEGHCFVAAAALIFQLLSRGAVDKTATLIFNNAPGREEFQKSVVDAYVRAYQKPSPRWPTVKIIGYSFMASADVLPLQAIDMVAWEGNLYAREKLAGSGNGPRPHFRAFVESQRFLGAYCSRKIIEERASEIDLLPSDVSPQPFSLGPHS